MKNIYFLMAMFVFGSFGSNASVPKRHSAASVALDTIKVGFEKDTTVLEGENILIAVRILGEIPKDSAIVVKYTIKTTDATTDKDFMFRGGNTFTFRASDAAIQSQYFELLTKKDDNEERESILLELNILQGGKIAKLTSKQCLILLQDFKTPTELATEKYKEESQATLKKVQDIINADKDTSESIGTIRVKKFEVQKRFLKDANDKEYKANVAKTKGFLSDTSFKPKEETVKIDTVEILFKYGVAAEIKVYAKDGEIYSNLWYNGYEKPRTRVGISFRHQIYRDDYRNFWLMGKSNPKSGIKMLDLLDYDPKIGSNYPPGDGVVKLTKKYPADNISVNTSLSSYVHLNFYSDLLNLLGTDPGNGLLQTEASAKIFLRTLPTKKKINFLFHYLSPYLKFSRFENGFRDIVPTKVKSETSSDSAFSIDRMLVNQRKFLDIGLKINLFDRISRFYNTTELNVFCNFGWFNRRGEKDILNSNRTGITQYQTIPSNTFDIGLEVRHSIFQYRNFGINLAAMVFAQRIWNNKLSTYANGGYEVFGRTEAELFYFPIANSKNKIFLRSYHVLNNNPKEANFTQLQFGYKLQFKLPNGKIR